MRICIYGAGAIGGWIGARLAADGSHEVSAIARGATAEALKRSGWRLQEGAGDERTYPVARVASDPRDIGPQDLVVVALKGQALPGIADAFAPLLDRDTVVLPAMNGVPWWFMDGDAGDANPLESVDPGGRLAAVVPHDQVVGCVVHAAVTAPSPGLALLRMGNGLIVGEPDGTMSDRLETLRAQLARAGFDVTASARIRYDVWFKLWGNLTMNPVSAMTGATADRILDDPLVRDFCTAVMEEARAIGDRIGCSIDQSAEDRHAVTRKLGAFKTSMLQDAEAARPLELDAIVGATREIGHRLGLATPNIDVLYGLARLFARSHGLYPAPSAA